MKKTPAISAILTLIALAMHGQCTLYVPNSINSPMLKKKGDYNITPHLSFIGFGDVHAAVSPFNNVLLTSNIMNGGIEGDYGKLSATNSYEFGTGVYKVPFNKDSLLSVLNIIGGYGHGYMMYKNNFPYDTELQVLTYKYNKAFIQFSYDKHYDEYLLSYSIKLSTINGTVTNQPIYRPDEPIKNNARVHFYTMELGITAHILEFIFLQYRFYTPIGNNSQNNYNVLVNDDVMQHWQRYGSISFGYTINLGNKDSLGDYCLGF